MIFLCIGALHQSEIPHPYIMHDFWVFNESQRIFSLTIMQVIEKENSPWKNMAGGHAEVSRSFS